MILHIDYFHSFVFYYFILVFFFHILWYDFIDLCIQKNYHNPKYVTWYTFFVEQTDDDVWGENGSLLTKQFNSNLSKPEDEQAKKLKNELTMLSEDKYRPYSSIRYNIYSHRNIKRNMPTVKRGSRESSGKPNNEFDDVTSCFKGRINNIET